MTRLSVVPAEGTVSCLHRNEIGRRYFSTALDYARTHKIIKTSQLCQTREVWHSESREDVVTLDGGTLLK